jgi:hypothetical protein
MTPLETILTWFDAQDVTIKVDFVALASHFHLNENIEMELDRDKQLELFKEYFKNERLTPKEEMQRTLFLKSLINFALEGRNTVEGWEKSRYRNEIIDEKLKKEGKNFGAYENFMKDYEYRKTKWVDWSVKWNALLKSNLSDEFIANWYFSEIHK